MRYSEIINEGRDSSLYHTMSFEKAIDVLMNDKMPARWMHEIPGLGKILGNSFTRSKNLNWYGNLKIEVDEKVLSQNNRIIPLDGERVFMHSLKSSKRLPIGRLDNPLAEEFVVGDIKNLHRAIKKVTVLAKNRQFVSDNDLLNLYGITKGYCEKWDILFDCSEDAMKKIKDYIKNELECYDRKIDLDEMANPTEEIQSKTYYHGTKNSAAAQSIIENGLQPGNQSNNARGHLKPVVGRTYLTSDLKYAIVYAIGGDMLGCSEESVKHLISKGDGNFGYVFVVNGADIMSDIQPDEDSVGEMVSYADHIIRGIGIGYGSETYHALKQKPLSWIENFLRNAKSSMTALQYSKAVEGWIAAQAAGGKKFLKSMSDSMKIELLNMGAHVAYQGAVRPTECWKFDKRLAPKLQKDGSNFFELAVKIDL